MFKVRKNDGGRPSDLRAGSAGGEPRRQRGKRMRRAASCTLLSLLAATALSAADHDTLTLRFDFPAPRIRTDGAYARVTMGDLPLTATAGEPALPYRPVRIVIPRGKKILAVDVEAGPPETLAGAWLVRPAERPVPLGYAGPPPPLTPDRSIYESDAPFPPSLRSDADVQRKSPYRLLLLNLYPVSYLPSRRELSYQTNLTVRVRLAPAPEPTVARARAGAFKDAGELLRGKVENPEALATYDAAAAEIGLHADAESYPHLIITSAAFADLPGPWNFQALRDHRLARGIRSAIVTTEYIYANFPGTRPAGGEDNQTRIRNFVAWAHENWGTNYVLLGGAGGIVPIRRLRADGTDIPADLYYGNLDGTFDQNANGVYGESNDGPGDGEVDLYAEAYIGRACVENAAEIANFVRKTVAYETSSAPSLHSAWMLGEHLGFGGVSEYATQSMEEIRLGSCAHDYCTDGFAASDFFAVSTLYDGPNYTWPKNDLVAIMNSGVHILNHLGHANYTYDMKLSTSDLPSLSNVDPFFLYSQGCMPGGFDTADCFGEVLTTMEKGAFAAVLNARYGWGQYSSTAGPSQYYNREFWDALFKEGIPDLGRMNADSKEDNEHRISGTCMRWCFYELNLFGDPAVEIQSIASKGTVELDAARYPLPGTATATVTDADLDADPSSPDTIAVWVSSGAETEPEPVTLTETGFSTKRFTGSIAIAPGDPVPGDGVLQAAHGDTIAVVYRDADDGTGNPAEARAAAVADGAAPRISNIRSAASARFCVVSWDTDEPATSEVCYGAAAPPGASASSAGFSTSHSVRLMGLSPLTDYCFSIASADLAGNEAADDNGGAWHRFTTPARSPILFVDDDEGEPYEPYFTAALDAAGYRYDIWDVAAEGAAPGFSDLSFYEAVVWNCGFNWEEAGSGISIADEAALASYLNAGGSLFLCGQDIIYNGVSTAFLSDHLHVSASYNDDGTSAAGGIEGDPISDGMTLPLSYPSTDYSDSLTPGPGASGAFLTDGSTEYPCCAVRFPAEGDAAPHRVVFSAFPFEAVSASAADPDNARTAMDRVLCFLSPVRITELSPPYGLNDRLVAVTLRGQGFKDGLALRFGALSIAPEIVEDGRVETTIPAGVAAGAYPVSVRNADAMKGTAPSPYTALDPAADDDGDGLRNDAEILTHGTSPLLADTDGDGLGDAEEIADHHTDPRIADSDGDGLLDGAEIARGADPWNRDTDGDGVGDYLEAMCGTDPKSFTAGLGVSINFQPSSSARPAGFAPDTADQHDTKGYGWSE